MGKWLPFTDEEKQIIYDNQFRSDNRIAIMLKRSTCGVRNELRRGGGKGNYTIDLSKQNYRLNEEIKTKGVKEYFQRAPELIDLQNRIEILEMQVNILTDVLNNKKE